MATSEQLEPVVYEEQIIRETDPAARYFGFGIVFLIICILCVVIYALVTGVFGAPAPRTLAEAAGAQAEVAVAESPGSGKAWSALAATRYAAGDEEGAWAALEQGATLVKDHSILFVHTRELEFLVAEDRNEEALKKAVDYAKVEGEYRAKEAAENVAKGITVPEGVGDYDETVRLYVLKAAAEGNLEKWDDAIATLTFALRLDYKAADVMTLRGWAKLRSGDAAGAKTDFEAALRYIPDYGSAKEGLDAVTSAGSGE